MAATMQNSKPQHYLRDFYLRVHPDLFGAHDSNAQMQNEDSLGRLNSILDFIQAVRCVGLSILFTPLFYGYLYVCQE